MRLAMVNHGTVVIRATGYQIDAASILLTTIKITR
jgi:hypothetical protein